MAPSACAALPACVTSRGSADRLDPTARLVEGIATDMDDGCWRRSYAFKHRCAVPAHRSRQVIEQPRGLVSLVTAGRIQIFGLDLIPNRCIGAGWHPEMDGRRFRWSSTVWWACQDLNLGPHPYQGSAPGPVSAGSRLQPARTTYRWRPLETVANRSAPMACGPNVDQATIINLPARWQMHQPMDHWTPPLAAGRPPSLPAGDGSATASRPPCTCSAGRWSCWWRWSPSAGCWPRSSRARSALVRGLTLILAVLIPVAVARVYRGMQLSD
jgi:hypothetical protein